jgi:hypothetical protein
MRAVSANTTALLCVVLALASLGRVCGAGKHELEYHMNGGSSRALMGGSGRSAASSSLPNCGTPAFTKKEMVSFGNMVDQFYRDGNRHRQQVTIEVEVNVVIVKNTNGTGATQAQVNAQIDILNNASSPDFSFILKNTTVVTNDTLFSISYDDPNRGIEKQLKTAYRKGGKETFNVYILKAMSSGGNIGGWTWPPWADTGVLDGVVLDYTTVPTGNNSFYNEGKVSAHFRVSVLVHLSQD